MSRTVYFYATKADLIQLCRALESEGELAYTLEGELETREAICYPSAVDIPNLGTAQEGSLLKELSYLVVERATPIKVLANKRRDGSDLFYAGQKQNPNSISVRPAGVYEDNCVIQGSMGSISSTPAARKLYRRFVKMLRKQFSTIENTYVGPEALQLGKQGWRLTQSSKLDRDTDLNTG